MTNADRLGVDDAGPTDADPASVDVTTTGATDPTAPVEPAVPVLREPVDGVPEPVTTSAQLQAAITGLAGGHGPLAVDAERASGYRYSQRAYLVQLRRAGYGSVLIDPIAQPDLRALNSALAGVEWILHAAHQDLACLAEVGLVPDRLFDTELAGRLLGEERVALGTMVEHYLGVGLEKGHSAADWSTRPLPHDWLVYAALDVELLIPLRAALATVLEDAGKIEWAEQEFHASRTASPAPARIDPWRRTSGIHSVRNRRQLAAIRALWHSRDELAAARDIAPGRILPDAAIVDAARKNPKTVDELVALPIFGGSRQRRNATRWFAAVQAAQLLPDDALPPVTGSAPDALPPSGRWRERSPEAAQRLAACREVIAAIAAEHEVLAQNLLASDTVRRLAWAPPAPVDDIDAAAVTADLTLLGARPWQIALTAARLADALRMAAAPPVPADPHSDMTGAEPPLPG
jgi:ribonuclease D